MAANIHDPANTLAPVSEEEVFPMDRNEIMANVLALARNSPSIAILGDSWHWGWTFAAICNHHPENMAIYI
ncbi:MAG: hypothetical protein ACFFFC_06610 [Candidatus Thorarchaeota archaeon]